MLARSVLQEVVVLVPVCPPVSLSIKTKWKLLLATVVLTIFTDSSTNNIKYCCCVYICIHTHMYVHICSYYYCYYCKDTNLTT